MNRNVPKLTPAMLVEAYRQGAFPMADGLGRIRWYTADPRGILRLEDFHVPRTLRQLVRQKRFEVRIDHDFEAVMRQCMLNRADGTWINDELVAAYTALHRLGMAHSVESWQDGQLVGGLYGVALGGAFFGESMFYRRPNASKVALVHLVERLRERGYELLDTQMVTEHMRRFGCVEIPAADYMALLRKALRKDCRFA